MLDRIKARLRSSDADEVFEKTIFPPSRGLVFGAEIRHPDVYIWDAWTYAEGETIDLYTLASPRSFYEQGGADLISQRDHLPHHWRRFASTDAGASWHDRGPVFTPRLGTDYFDSRSIWTGSIMPYQGRFLSGYTGVRELGDAQPKLQALGLAVSDDRQNFTPLSTEAFSCPLRDYDAIRAAGYYLGPRETLGNAEGEEGGAILAWRDPGLALDRQGRIHAFWGAKSSARKPQEAVLGHGIIENPYEACQFTLLAPVRVPDAAEFTEAEVPQVLWNSHDEVYVLMLSTTNKVQGMPIEDVELTLRLYVADDLGQPWRVAGKRDIGGDKRYPGVLCGLRRQGDRTEICYNAPFSAHADAAVRHTMPALSYLPLDLGAKAVG